MKKLFSLLAVSGLLFLTSCGGPSEEEKKKMQEDSLKAVQLLDSLFKQAEQNTTDTTASDTAK
jgi:hypothetical protein